jgi:hypothetical protein
MSRKNKESQFLTTILICINIKSRKIKIIFLKKEVEMIKPIVLSSCNERLIGYSEETVEEGSLIGCIGRHEVCGGWIDFKEISSTHHAIVCRNCGLRITIPKIVKTYGGLRDYLLKSSRH